MADEFKFDIDFDEHQFSQDQSAKQNFLASMDKDPEEAARAVELSQHSGVPTSFIRADVEGFERQHRAALSTDLIGKNRFLQEYLEGDPLVGQLSHDDIGNLDKASQSIKSLNKDTWLSDWLKKLPTAGLQPVERGEFEETLKGVSAAFVKGAGEERIGQTLFQRPSDVEWALAHPEVAAVAGAATIPLELMGRFFGGMISLGHEGMVPIFGKSFADEMAGMAEWGMTRGDIGTGMKTRRGVHEQIAERGITEKRFGEMMKTSDEAEPPRPPPVSPDQISQEHVQKIRDALHGMQVSDIYARAGEEPPPHVDPLIDKAKELQVKEDLDRLDEAKQDIDATATRERSQEHAARFHDIHGEQMIAVDIEAVRRLYGDKIPEEGDGLLGWVPGLAERLAGGDVADIYISRGDYLAKIEKEGHQELREDLRPRDGGLTLNETRIEAEPKQVIAEPLPSVRGGAGLEPMAHAGDRKLTLRRREKEGKTGQDMAEKAGHTWEDLAPEDQAEWMKEAQGQEVPEHMRGFHDVEILDDRGQEIGMINLSEQEGGKMLYVDMIQAGTEVSHFYEPNFLGFSAIRAIKQQLKTMFPDVEHVTGHRVSGAREKAGAVGEPSAMPKVKLEEMDDPQPFRDMLDAMWDRPYRDVEALFGTEEKGLARNSPMGRIVMQEIARIVPGAKIDVAHGLTVQGRPAFGVYMPGLKSIIVSLESTHPIGTGHHEAVHFLRGTGLIGEHEWSSLITQSLKDDWKGQLNNFDKRYAGASESAKMEEVVADAYRLWQAGKLKVSDPAVFQRIKEFLENLLKRVQDHLGIDRELGWEEVFKRIESGEIGRRGAEEARGREAPMAQFPIEEGKAVGVRGRFLTKEEELIQKRNKEDYEAAVKRAEAKAKRELAPEIKARRLQVEDEVRQELEGRPDLALDKTMTEVGLKIDPKFLTDEQRERLPKDYVQKKGGINPDEFAGLFGFTSGDALVERMAMLTNARKRLGMTQKEYFKNQVEDRVRGRIEREFGGREAELLEEYRDQALSDTQMKLIHEETLSAALKLGIEPKITLDDMKSMARKVLDDTPVGEIKSARYLQKAGTIMQRVAEAMQKGKHEDAYRLLQARQVAALMAKEAVKYERARKAFDKTAKFFSKTPTEEIAKRIDQSYYNFVQQTLKRLDIAVRRTSGEIDEAIRMESDKHEAKEGARIDNLKDFIVAKHSEFREVNVPDFVLDPTWPGRKEGTNRGRGLDNLTHSEFNDLHDMLKTMEHEGRDERSLVLGGERIELDETLETMRQQVKDVASLEPETLKIDRPRTVREKAKAIWWSHITPETMWDRLDRGDQQGWFHRTLIYPAARAINLEKALGDEFRVKFKEIKFDNMDKVVENTLFKDPNTGELIPMRRRNALAVLAQWGNESNIRKLTEGWKVEVKTVEDWLRRNTTKEDWDNMQKVGRLSEDLFNKANDMSHEVTGVGIKRVELKPFFDPHGVERRGWYSPVSYEPRLPEGKTVGKDALEREGYYRATTDQRYTKERTGKTAPTDLTLDVIPQRMGQVIHDIAVRPTMLQMSKILYDEGMQRDIIAHYGKAQLDEMKSWMQDFANRRNVDSAGQAAYNTALGYLRSNIIGNLIGFNPGTVMKHTPTALVNSMAQVGPFSFMKASFEMFRTDPVTQQRIMRQVYEESAEIRGRMANYADLMRGVGESFSFEQGTIGWLRELNLKMGSAPVSFGDYMSVSPTYWAARNKAIERGASVAEAIDIGDAAVRQAHGTSRLTGQPGVMRTNELGRMYTSLYGFFSHMLQQQYKLAWKARDLLNGEKPLDIEGHWAPHMLGKFMSYYIIPAIIEELVTPYTNEEKDSWGMKAGKGLAMGLSASLTQVRDLVRGLVNPQQRAGGLLDTAMDLPKRVISDFKGPMNKEHAARLIKDTIALNGILTGTSNAEQGNVVEYIFRYTKGMERPKGPWDVAVGLRYGKTDKHSHTFAEWWKHTVGGKH